jgi:hypothetical protein
MYNLKFTLVAKKDRFVEIERVEIIFKVAKSYLRTIFNIFVSKRVWIAQIFFLVLFTRRRGVWIKDI